MQLKLHATIVARTLFRGWRSPIISKLIGRAIKRISPSPPEKSTHLSTKTMYAFFQLNPPSAEEIHLRWMKSLRDEIPLTRDEIGRI